jgi:hypothetical protein
VSEPALTGKAVDAPEPIPSRKPNGGVSVGPGTGWMPAGRDRAVGARTQTLRPEQLRVFQGTMGNRALSRLANERAGTGEPRLPVPVQRQSKDSSGGGGAPGDSGNDGAEGHAPHLTPSDVAKLPDDEKATTISNMLDGSASVDVAADCWRTFGDQMAAANRYNALFERLVKADSSVLDNEPYKGLKAKFERDVEDQARRYLWRNRKTVSDEMVKTGVNAEAEGKAVTADQDFAVVDAQKAAAEMERVKEAKTKLRQVKLGFLVNNNPDGVRLVGPFDPGGMGVLSDHTPAPGYPKWEEVNAQWLLAVGSEAAIIRKHPSASYFIGESGDPAAFKKAGDVKEARAMIAKATGDMLAKIDKATPLVGADLTFIDFPPIHSTLMNSGSSAVSGTVWSKPVEKKIAGSAIKDANLSHLLTTLAIGSASAAAFILAEIATGGLATFLFAAGAAASIGQAAQSWDHYSDLSKASAATVDPELALVTGDQVDAAMTSAILDTVFAAIDGFQAAKGAYVALKGGKAVLEAGKAGAEAATRTALRNLGKSGTNSAAVVEKALAELGPQEVQRISGKSFENLADIVGKESDAGKRLLAWSTEGVNAISKDTATLLTKLAEIGKLPAEEAEKVLAASLEVNGFVGTLKKCGGWKNIMGSGVGAGASAKSMESWRASLVKELQTYISKESDNLSKVARTGTSKAANDLDVQILGGAAAELQEKANGWLAGRLGTDVNGAKKLLDAEIFVDPTRAHLFDIMKGLDAETRTAIAARSAAFEKQMVYGARLKEAEKAGSAAVEKVMAEAKEHGVEPFKEFVKLSGEEQGRLAKQVDGWMLELEKTTDPAVKKDLVEKVSRTQAMINASHPDAYVGGGVKVWVTGRDLDAEAIAKSLGIDVKTLTSVTDAQRVVSSLAEGKWMDAASKSLSKGGTPEEMARAIKDLGKHGSRSASVLRVPGKTDVAKLGDLADKLANYKVLHEKGELVKSLQKGELAAYRTELSGLLAQLKTDSAAAIKALEGEAKALNIAASEMAEFQAWVRWRATVAAVSDGLSRATAGYIRTLETAVSAADKASGSPPADPSPAEPPPSPGGSK